MSDKEPKHSNDETWLAHARQRLDDSENSIDGVTLGRLRAARRTALARAQHKPLWQRTQVLVPATGVALALLVVAGIDQQTPSGAIPAVQSASLLEDLPLLSGEDELEMLTDLEFYLWLNDVESELG